MMVRLVHSEVKNKKVSEWTSKAVSKIQKNQMLNKQTRPAPVLEYLQRKEKAEILRRIKLAGLSEE